MNAKIGMQIFGTAKRIVKEHRSSNSLFIRLFILILDTLWYAIRTTIRVCVDEEFRSIFLLRLLNSRNVHQTTPLTYMNRYPEIFSACRDHFDTKQDLKILSYGCSTGEEVLTLRKYFPNAHIIGADINKRSLKICRKLNVDEKITFIYSTPSEIQKHGPFDAIFCMAVLQRKPHYIAAKGISSLKKIYPFEKFEKQIIEFDELINPQGLLIVHFTQYSLLDTIVASNYKTLGNYNQDTYNSPVFDKNSSIIKDRNSLNTIFIKMNGKVEWALSNE
ncbi:methyltransferase domain-containing protein [Paenibacillus cremeus]|uniref:Methyltransferase domain-containing protein n=1 Tax=Paenibacillus cremeus TaxID=2163881 RepID=A0A559JMK0_9BACL|nr:methyltransferase domain-containing protein [Paenibacillus cremeus]TVY01090.1 methyltransferase domain-containing protein [Paenibacillus cremeus]